MELGCANPQKDLAGLLNSDVVAGTEGSLKTGKQNPCLYIELHGITIVEIVFRPPTTPRVLGIKGKSGAVLRNVWVYFLFWGCARLLSTPKYSARIREIFSH